MPKFYLDVVVDDRLIPDNIGIELVSREAAIAEGLAMADDLASTSGDEDRGPGLVFVLCDERHEQIASFPVNRPDMRANGCRVVVAQDAPGAPEPPAHPDRTAFRLRARSLQVYR